MIQFPSPEPMSYNQILERAHLFWLEVVKEFGPDHLLKNGINFNEIYDAVIYPKYEISLDKSVNLGFDEDGDQILGQFIIDRNAALISSELCDNNDPREIFTCWHEVAGHGVLQEPYLKKTIKKDIQLYTTQRSITLFESNFERQANLFAANVAAPKNFVYAIYINIFGMERRIKYCGPMRYSLNYKTVYASSPLNLAYHIAKRMKRFFGGLSTESLSYQVLDVCVDMNGYNRGEFFKISQATQKISNVIGDHYQ